MKVLFMFSLNDVPSAEKPLRTPESLQLGLSYVSAMLKGAGHQTRLLVLSRVFREAARRYVQAALADFVPDVVGFSSVSSEYPFIREVGEWVRELAPRAKRIIGGAHASLEPKAVIRDFDAVCVGEGEHAALEYVSQLQQKRDPTKIANLWIRHGDGSIEHNPPRPFVTDLDSLPLPDRQMWEPWIGEEAAAKPSVLLGRGCPFQCTYCCHHKFRSLGEGTYVRFRSPKAIAAEIRQILDSRPDYREIYLEQETIAVRLPWAEQLCDELEALNRTLPRPVSFGVNVAVTPNIDYDRLFAALNRANVRYVNIGLESGSERLRREVLKRRYSNQDILNAVSAARRHGLRIALFNMIGLPSETPEEFNLTVEMNRQCQPDWHYTSIFYPYPGTDLYRLCKDQGLLPKDSDDDPVVGIDMERSQATLDLPTFPRDQVQRSYEWFDYHVYRGHRARIKLLAKVARCKLKSRPKLNRLYRMAARSMLGRGIDRVLNPFVGKLGG
jgi:radical SAM superfamily enzyme YgiQ (UPF0313 family)